MRIDLRKPLSSTFATPLFSDMRSQCQMRGSRSSAWQRTWWWWISQPLSLSIPVAGTGTTPWSLYLPKRRGSRTLELSTGRKRFQGVLTYKLYNPSFRLDRLTSGLLMFGRNPSKAREMETQIRTRQVSKEYIARVEGEFPVWVS